MPFEKLLKVADALDITKSDPRSICVLTFKADFVLDPPVSLEIGRSNFTTEKDGVYETGVVYAQGKVNGSPVIPGQPGTYGEKGWNDGNCAAGKGKGEFTCHIPTEAGMQEVTGTYDIMYTGLVGVEVGPNIIASFEYVPNGNGDCLTTPLAGFTLIQEQILFTAATAEPVAA